MGLTALVFAWVLVPETHRQVKPNKLKVKATQSRQKVVFNGYLPGHFTTFIVLMLVSFTLTFTFAFISPVMVFYAYNDLNFSATQFGLLVGVLGLAMVLGQIFLGGLSDKYGRKPIIVLGLIVSSIFYVGMIIFTRFGTCFLVSAVGGIGSALANSATGAGILDISDEDNKSRIQGIKGSFTALGEAIGPLLAVFISSQLTPHSMFMVSAIIGIAVAFMTLIVLRGKRQTNKVNKNTKPSKLVSEAAYSGQEMLTAARTESN
jgi:MFS transporter, DHA1 family, multidrug resistance protein